MHLNRETISDRQGIAVLALFIMGSTLVMGAGAGVQQNGWIAVLMATLLAIPMYAVYSRLLSLYPGKGLYEILYDVLGKVGGKIASLFFIWYSIHLGSLVFRDFWEFIKVAQLPETPGYVSVILIGLVCIWAVKEGIEVLGRWSKFSIIFLITIVTVISILSVTNADIDNLRPLLYMGIKPILKNTFYIFTFPFAETVVFMACFYYTKGRNNPYKVYYRGLATGAFFILLISIRNIAVLGTDFAEQLYFVSYTVISLINIGDFIQRIEASVAVIFLLAGLVKISICLLSASIGIDRLFNLGNYRQIVAPIGLLTMVTSCFLFKSTMELFEWTADVYKYYAFPFQVILPLGIWITAEIKTKRKKQIKQ